MARRRNRPKKPTFTEEETNEALRQYNAAMKRAEDERRAEKAARRADTARRSAADALRTVRDDPRSSADDVEAAETRYRDAVAEWNRLTGTATEDPDPAGP